MNPRNDKYFFFYLVVVLSFLLINPSYATNVSSQVKDQFRQQNYDEAIELLATLNDTERALLLRIDGLSFFYTDNHNVALPLLEQLQRDGNMDDETRFALATIYFSNTNLNPAITLLDAISTSDSEINSRANLLRAKIFLSKNDDENAIRVLERFDTSNTTAFQRSAQLLAQIYISRGDEPKATDIVQKAISLKPESFESSQLRYLMSLANQSRYRWDFSTALGYRMEYDNNVSIGSDNATIQGSTRQADVRATLLVDSSFRKLISKNWAIYGDGHFYQNAHQNLSQYNETHADVSLSPVFSQQSINFRFPFEVSEKREAGKLFSRSLSFLPGISATNRYKLWTHVFAKMRGQQYEIFVEEPENPNYRYMGGGVLLLIPLMNNHGSARLVGEYGNYDAVGSNWDRRTYSVFGSVSYKPFTDVVFDIGLQYEASLYANLHTVEVKQRNDSALWFTAKTSYRLSSQWTLFAQTAQVDQRSTIEYYQYRRSVNAAGVQWTF